MVDRQFVIDSFPSECRLAKYEQELTRLEKANDTDGIIKFSHQLFLDCCEYVKSSMKLRLPNLYLQFLSHADFTAIADKMDRLLGEIPRHGAMIIGDIFGSPPTIYIDFQLHLESLTPKESVLNLCCSYMEELVHAAKPSAGETQIHDDVCSAIEGFLAITLPESVKQYRLAYSNECDKLKEKW